MAEISDIHSSAPLLRRILIGGAATAVLLIVGLFAVPYLTPKSIEKAIIQKGLSYVFEREVQVMGDTRFTILPSLYIKATSVVLPGYGKPGPDNAVLLDIETLELDIETLALFADEVVLRKLYINEPQIRFVRDLDGDANWQPAEITKPLVAKPDQDWGWWRNMSVGDVRVSKGRFLYVDRQAGRKIIGENLNLRAFRSNATGAEKGISVTGSAEVNGETTEVTVDIGAIGQLLAGGRLPVVGKITSAFGAVDYQGAIAKRQYLVSDGRFIIEAPAIRQLEMWLGPIFDTPLNGGLKISGRLNANGNRVALDDFSFHAADNHLSGKALFTKGVASRRMDADLIAPSMDLKPFMSLLSNSFWASAFVGTANIQWSEGAYGRFTTGPGEAVVSLKESPRRVELSIPQVALFGGFGRADVQLGVGEGMTSFRTELQLNRIKTGLLLEKFEAAASLSGDGDLHLSLFSVGSDFDELLAALKGNGDFNILAGGVYHEALADYLMKGSPDSLPFTQLIGSFSVNQGILEGNDLLLKAPRISLVGDGAIDLTRRFADIRLQSLFAGTADTDDDLRDVRPFRIRGQLDELQIQPEDG